MKALLFQRMILLNMSLIKFIDRLVNSVTENGSFCHTPATDENILFMGMWFVLRFLSKTPLFGYCKNVSFGTQCRDANFKTQKTVLRESKICIFP